VSHTTRLTAAERERWADYYVPEPALGTLDERLDIIISRLSQRDTDDDIDLEEAS
jgi:hypothetical protein